MAGKYKLTNVPLTDGKHVKVYASPRVSKALGHVTEDMNLFKGVKLAQVFEAVYAQGKKDGARAAFDEVSKGFRDAQKKIPHKRPGRPKKKR